MSIIMLNKKRLPCITEQPLFVSVKRNYLIPSFFATSAGNAFLFTMKQVVLYAK